MSDIAVHAMKYNIFKFILCYIANNYIQSVISHQYALFRLLIYSMFISLKIITIQVWLYNFLLDFSTIFLMVNFRSHVSTLSPNRSILSQLRLSFHHLTVYFLLCSLFIILHDISSAISDIMWRT